MIRGRLKDLTFDRDGAQIITITVPNDDFRGEFDKLKEQELDIEIKKHRERRSLDANAYCWVLCQKLSKALSTNGAIITKNEVYRNAIKDIGVYKDFRDLTPGDASTLQTAWSMLGTGWIAEQVDYSQDGERVTIRCYYGSSRYDSNQMSRLIDDLIQDCQAVGIETMTPAQIAELKSKWSNAPGKDT